MAIVIYSSSNIYIHSEQLYMAAATFIYTVQQLHIAAAISMYTVAIVTHGSRQFQQFHVYFPLCKAYSREFNFALYHKFHYKLVPCNVSFQSAILVPH